MQLQRQSLPALTSICYQTNNEECELQLIPLFTLLRNNQIDTQSEQLSLVGLFKLLQIWKLDIPFSQLAKIFNMANRFAHQQLNQLINIHAFHQIMHNPSIQQLYRRNTQSDIYNLQPIYHSIPQTLVGLFTKLAEFIQRQKIQNQINHTKDNQEKYKYIIQMMKTTITPRPKQYSIQEHTDNYNDSINQGYQQFSTQSKVDSIMFKEEEEIFPSVEKQYNNNGQKFKKLNDIFEQKQNDQFKSNSRLRKINETMQKHMLELKNSHNVIKITKLIRQTQGSFDFKLPEL